MFSFLLPLVLVWAWYVLLTGCTIVLSPVYLYSIDLIWANKMMMMMKKMMMIYVQSTLHVVVNSVFVFYNIIIMLRTLSIPK